MHASVSRTAAAEVYEEACWVPLAPLHKRLRTLSERRERERPHCPPAGRERKSLNFKCGFIIHYLNHDIRLTRPHFLSENVQAQRHQSVTKRVPPQSSKPKACSSFTLLFFFLFPSPGFREAKPRTSVARSRAVWFRLADEWKRRRRDAGSDTEMNEKT